MLKTLPGRPAPHGLTPEHSGSFAAQLAQEYVDFGQLLAAARRQWQWLAACTLAAAALAALYLLVATPRYTASADLFLDHHSNLLPDQNAPLATLFDTEATTLSQIEIVKSDSVIGRVVDDLKLTGNPAFDADTTPLLSPLRSVLKPVTSAVTGFFGRPAAVPSQDELRSRTIDELGKNLVVTRTGQTYVINVNYTSKSPQLAADIVNALATAYLGEELRTAAETSGKASQWLDARIAEIKQQSLAADLAVQNFSASNGLVAAGGQLVTDQQLATLNAMLLQAQSDTAKSEAQYNRLQDIVASGQTDASVADALDSPVINNLQGRYSEAAQREHEIAARVGSSHTQAIRLRDEMADYKRQMFDELSRIASSYQSDLAMARARQESLQRQFDDATAATQGASKSQVQLRALQLESDNYRSLYQAYLQRYQQLRQQQTFPVSDARIISAAHVPFEPSLPRGPLVIAIFTAIGIFIGLATAAMREVADRSLHTAADVRRHLNLRFLGYVEDLAPEKLRRAPSRSASTARSVLPNLLQIFAERPHSISAETLRRAIATLENSETSEPLVVGMVSALSGEGKTTLAANLAAAAASLGRRTLLIDGDRRNHELTDATVRNGAPRVSIAEMPGAAIFEISVRGHKARYALQPVPQPGDACAEPERNSKLINQARKCFDLIIVDLPAAGVHSDALMLADDIDVFLVVAAWGETGRDSLQSLLRDDTFLFARCAGVILNRTSLKRLARYRGIWSGEPAYATVAPAAQEARA